jgi:hypothetical protein
VIVFARGIPLETLNVDGHNRYFASDRISYGPKDGFITPTFEIGPAGDRSPSYLLNNLARRQNKRSLNPRSRQNDYRPQPITGFSLDSRHGH